MQMDSRRHNLEARDVIVTVSFLTALLILWPLCWLVVFILLIWWILRMVRIAHIIFLTGFVLCAIVIVHSSQDCTVPGRNVIWAAMTLILFAISKKDWDVHPILIAFFFFWLIVSISILLAINFGEAVYGSFRVFLMMVFLFVSASILKDQRYFSKAIILLAIGVGLYNILVLAVKGQSILFLRGLMGNKNHTSSAFFLLMILCAYYWKQWKIPATVAIAISMFMICFLRARATWLAVLVAGTVFAFTYRKYAVYTIVGLILASGVTYYIKGNSILNTESMAHRVDLWKQTCRMIKDNPLGVGSGNWKIAYLEYSKFMSPSVRKLMYEERTFFKTPHNDPLQICAEVGIFGFVSYLLLFALALYYSRGLIRIGISGYIAMSLFTFPFERPFLVLLLMIFFALAILQCKPRKLPRKFVINRKWGIAVMILLCLTLADFTERLIASERGDKIFHALNNRNWDDLIKETDNISKFSNIDISGTPLAYYRGFAYIRKRDKVNALSAYQQAIEANPNQPYVLSNLAACYAMNGYPLLSMEYYLKTMKRYPDFTGAGQDFVKEIVKFGRQIHGYKARNL
jgi:O-antigen ligase